MIHVDFVVKRLTEHALNNYIASFNKSGISCSLTQVLVSSAAGCRYTGSNRIISFVVIKYKKNLSHAATEKDPTEKRAPCTCRVMFCSLKVA